VAGETRFYYRDTNAPQPNSPRRFGTMALIKRDGSLLLERRADAPVWALVGGDLDDDETWIDSLSREVREETGLEVTSCDLFGTFSDPTRIVRYPDGNVVRIVSLVYRVSVETFESLQASSESRELRFFPADELLGLDLAATHRHVLETYVGGGPEPHLE
jgi:ADP-ribose pyrophosphatase YjhB (NUDIX family)